MLIGKSEEISNLWKFRGMKLKKSCTSELVSVIAMKLVSVSRKRTKPDIFPFSTLHYCFFSVRLQYKLVPVDMLSNYVRYIINPGGLFRRIMP